MGRKSSRELVGKVASSLEWQPKSIQEIADEIGASRNSVRHYLEALTNLPNVKEYHEYGGDRCRYFGKAQPPEQPKGGQFEP